MMVLGLNLCDTVEVPGLALNVASEENER